MSLVVALVFTMLMFATAAQAQISVPLLPCTAIVTPRALDLPVRPAGVPDALKLQDPSVLSCKTIVEVNTVGGAAAMWCGTKLYLYAVRWTSVNQQMMADFMDLAMPGDTPEKMRAMQAKYQDTNVWDMCDVWGPARDRINAAMPAPVTWVVAKFSVQPTRPGFFLSATGTLTPAPLRATVGSACDCADKSLDAGGAHYCTFVDSEHSNVGSAVTVCSKVP